MTVTKVEILPIHPQNGLMAFACVELDGRFYVSSIGVHRKRDGSGYRITYPTKRIGEYSQTICHPITQALSKEIEHAVCEKAGKVLGDLA